MLRAIRPRGILRQDILLRVMGRLPGTLHKGMPLTLRRSTFKRRLLNGRPPALPSAKDGTLSLDLDLDLSISLFSVVFFISRVLPDSGDGSDSGRWPNRDPLRMDRVWIGLV